VGFSGRTQAQISRTMANMAKGEEPKKEQGSVLQRTFPGRVS